MWRLFLGRTARVACDALVTATTIISRTVAHTTPANALQARTLVSVDTLRRRRAATLLQFARLRGERCFHRDAEL